LIRDDFCIPAIALKRVLQFVNKVCYARKYDATSAAHLADFESFIRMILSRMVVAE
jgi:hypothetical protein